MSERQDSIKYKWLPNGTLRAYRSDRKAKDTVSEKCVFYGGHIPNHHNCSRVEVLPNKENWPMLILINRLSGGGGMPHHIAKRNEDMLRREPLAAKGRLPMYGGNGDKTDRDMRTGGIRMDKLLHSGKTRLCRGVTIDLYNQSCIEKVCCTVTTRIDSCGHYYITTMKEQREEQERPNAVTYEAANGHKYEISIRKYTPRDCFRLMGVRDEDFDKLLATDETGKRLVSNSKLYQLAGNSIVTNCMTAMFEELFYPSCQYPAEKDGQLALF